MRDQLIPLMLLLGGEVVFGLAILVVLDMVRGKKIRLEKIPTREGRIQSSPRRRVAEAIIFQLLAFYLLLTPISESHGRPFLTRPMTILSAVCATVLFIYSLIDLFRVIRDQRKQTQASS